MVLLKYTYQLNTHDMIKAYSYLRFSTPEQGRGDSFRRQAELAKNYAALNDLELDEKMQFHDLAVSAYHGRNARIGALKNFLDQIEIGKIERGSYLLVESLDRITRDEMYAALRLFLKIINIGITLVTLMDDKKYSKKSVNANPTDLITSILIMMRAFSVEFVLGAVNLDLEAVVFGNLHSYPLKTNAVQ